MPFTHFALFIIFIEHQFKKVLKQNLVKKKNDPTIERGKIQIPFNVRPTSTLGPKRDRRVYFCCSNLKSYGLGTLLRTY
jgi:hypothetical protein